MLLFFLSLMPASCGDTNCWPCERQVFSCSCLTCDLSCSAVRGLWCCILSFIIHHTLKFADTKWGQFYFDHFTTVPVFCRPCPNLLVTCAYLMSYNQKSVECISLNVVFVLHSTEQRVKLFGFCFYFWIRVLLHTHTHTHTHTNK